MEGVTCTCKLVVVVSKQVEVVTYTYKQVEVVSRQVEVVTYTCKLVEVVSKQVEVVIYTCKLVVVGKHICMGFLAAMVVNYNGKEEVVSAPVEVERNKCNCLLKFVMAC